MNVVQRQAEQNAVLGRPLPGVNQSCYLGLDVLVGCHHALRATGGAAGIQDHGAPLGIDLGQRLRLTGDSFVPPQQAQSAGRRNRRKHLFPGSICHQRCRLRIADVVFEFGSGRAERKRNRNAARSPDTPLNGNPRKSRRNQKEHTLLVQIAKTVQQRRCDTSRGIQQMRIPELSLAVEDRVTSGMNLGALNEWKLNCGIFHLRAHLPDLAFNLSRIRATPRYTPASRASRNCSQRSFCGRASHSVSPAGTASHQTHARSNHWILGSLDRLDAGRHGFGHLRSRAQPGSHRAFAEIGDVQCSAQRCLCGFHSLRAVSHRMGTGVYLGSHRGQVWADVGAGRHHPGLCRFHRRCRIIAECLAACNLPPSGRHGNRR